MSWFDDEEMDSVECDDGGDLLTDIESGQDPYCLDEDGDSTVAVREACDSHGENAACSYGQEVEDPHWLDDALRGHLN